VDRYADWLTGRAVSFGPSFMNAPAREDRTHVQLDADTGAADEGNLFTTAALPLSHLNRYGVRHDVPFRERFAEIILTTRLNASAWCGEAAAQLNILHPLGGERRLVHWRAVDLRNLWECPETVSAKLSGAKQVRMALATPAIFRDDEMKHGWKPGWLNDDLEGSPPNAANVTLKLVGVATQRWRAVSGWSLADLPNQPRGPKPVKRMVPAGGVYFFEIIRGQAEDLISLWLEPISDDMQDRRDGFGLAVWGTW
jgi:CRISPR-associated protein Cmr3